MGRRNNCVHFFIIQTHKIFAISRCQYRCICRALLFIFFQRSKEKPIVSHQRYPESITISLCRRHCYTYTRIRPRARANCNSMQHRQSNASRDRYFSRHTIYGGCMIACLIVDACCNQPSIITDCDNTYLSRCVYV